MRPPDILVQSTEQYDKWNTIPHHTQTEKYVSQIAPRIYFSRLSVASCSLGYSRDEQLKDFESHLIASGAKKMPTSKVIRLIGWLIQLLSVVCYSLVTRKTKN